MGENKHKKEKKKYLLEASKEAGVKVNDKMANSVYEHSISSLVTRIQD